MKINTEKDKSIITLELPSKIFPYPEIRNLSYDICDTFLKDASSKLLHRIEIIVDELCNNAVEHGSNINDQIKVIFEIKKEQLIIMVEDEGQDKKNQIKNIKEIQKNIKENEENTLNLKDIRGRGLAYLVTKFADKYEIFENSHNNGICFKVTINLNKN